MSLPGGRYEKGEPGESHIWQIEQILMQLFLYGSQSVFLGYQ